MSPASVLLKASHFAARHHAGQFRHGGDIPYINHPIEVADILASEAGIDDSSILAAALLHDTLEDTRATFEELVAEFGPFIANTVAELTNDATLPKSGRKEEQVRRAATYSPAAAIVRAADEIANLRSVMKAPPPSWTKARCAAYVTWMTHVADAMPALPEKLDRLHRETLQTARETLGPDDGSFSYASLDEH